MSAASKYKLERSEITALRTTREVLIPMGMPMAKISWGVPRPTMLMAIISTSMLGMHCQASTKRWTTIS